MKFCPNCGCLLLDDECEWCGPSEMYKKKPKFCEDCGKEIIYNEEKKGEANEISNGSSNPCVPVD